jgi:cytochrome o ubiquinol oxidase subunit 1
VWHIWWLAIIGLIGAIGTVIVYSFQKNEGFYIPAATVAAIEGNRSGAGAQVEHAGARVTLEVD